VVELERGKPTARLDKILQVLTALGLRMAVLPPHSDLGGTLS